MKKFISTLICTFLLLNTFPVFAENDTPDTVNNTEILISEQATPESSEGHAPTEAVSDSGPDAPKSEVTVTATIADVEFLKESDATIELYSTDGQLLDSITTHITAMEDIVTFVFEVPEFEIGTDFIVKAKDGIDSIIYYEDTYYTGTPITLPTYKYIDKNGNEAVSTDIAVTINPLYHKAINLYYNGTSTPTRGARVLDGNALVPAGALADFLGFDTRYDDEYKSQVISLDGKYMYFNVGTAYTTVFGNDLFAVCPTVMLDGKVYISLRTFAEAIGSTLDVRDYMTHLDINISESTVLSEYYTRLPINRMNVSSRTNYMVWVSLSEYKVRLYEGRQNHWKPILEAPCAIGAPGTPTVTGSFEYNYKTRWDYGSYYVGPCLVFYRGYALHSVLLNNNGTEYDGRVGVKISHGCVRLKKNDIDFIANTIPVGTRIYITP